MTTDERIQAMAGLLAAALVTKVRDDGTRYVALEEGDQDWMRGVVQDAHGEMFPDDYRYRMISEAAESIAGGDTDPHEMADAAVSCYHGERIAWLGSYGNRWQYVDDAVEELGYPGDLSQAIAYGWYGEATETWNLLMSALAEQAEQEEANDTGDREPEEVAP